MDRRPISEVFAEIRAEYGPAFDEYFRESFPAPSERAKDAMELAEKLLEVRPTDNGMEIVLYDNMPVAEASALIQSSFEAWTREKQRHEMHWIDATPDAGYIARILSSYIDESYYSDNMLGLQPENEICKKMNEWREDRNKLLREALKHLASRQSASEPSGEDVHYIGKDAMTPDQLDIALIRRYLDNAPRKSITDKGERQVALDALDRLAARSAEKAEGEVKALREAIIESLTEIDRQTGEICPLCSEERPSHQDHCPVITLNTALLLREDKQDAPHA